MKGLLIVSALSIVVVISACKVAVDRTVEFAPTKPVVVQERISPIPVDTSDILYEGLMSKHSVGCFYQASKGLPYWFREGKLVPDGDSLINFIMRADHYGLRPDWYHLRSLTDDQWVDSAQSAKLRVELLLTDAFFTLSRHLKYGVRSPVPHTCDSASAELLRSVGLQGGVRRKLESREPEHAGYRSLRRGLIRLLDSVSNADVEQIALKKRVRLVEINLERWRAEQGQIEERYLFINVPSFMLYVIDGSDTVMRSKIIVGKPKTPTPVISSVIECFTIYPYWHVPKKIAAEEYLPIIRQDTSFLSKNNFDVLDQKGRILNRDSIPWSEYSKDYFPVSLRQREGSKNALGLIKFHFDNPFAVFLHDTNARNLFNSKVRAFSHGCIRMEDAETLAHYLATGHVGQRSKLVERYLAERRKGIINALQPLPVYIRYFTVEGVDGRLVYYKDIYGKDQRLNALLHPEASGL